MHFLSLLSPLSFLSSSVLAAPFLEARQDTTVQVATVTVAAAAATITVDASQGATIIIIEDGDDGNDISVDGANNSSVSDGGAAIDSSLVPQFGVVTGTNANAQQIGSCDGFNGENSVLIPCFCPPDRDLFIQHLSQAVAEGNVLGTPIQFSTDVSDQSDATNIARATAMVIVLQNFNGTQGVGCPAASAPNFLSQQQTGVVSNTIFVGAQ